MPTLVLSTVYEHERCERPAVRVRSCCARAIGLLALCHTTPCVVCISDTNLYHPPTNSSAVADVVIVIFIVTFPFTIVNVIKFIKSQEG